MDSVNARPGSGSSTRIRKSRARPPTVIRKLCTVPAPTPPCSTRRPEPRMVAVEIGDQEDQSVDVASRGTDRPLNHPQLTHPAAPGLGPGVRGGPAEEPSRLHYHPGEHAAGHQPVAVVEADDEPQRRPVTRCSSAPTSRLAPIGLGAR